MQKQIIDRIKCIRIEKGMTQTELAEKCSISKSLMSKLEADKANLHLDLLIAIARGLNVGVSDLIEASPVKNRATVVRERAKKNMAAGVPGKKGYKYYRMAGSENTDTFWLLINKEARKNPRYVVHDGYEFFLLMEGRIKLQFRDEEHILDRGDTAFFDSRSEHRILPLGDDYAQLLIIFSI